MTSLTNKYTELNFTKKSWEFVSKQKDYPFNNLPEEGSGSRNIFTMKDVKAVLPKTTKNNSIGIFASKAAKKLFEKSGLDQKILNNPSGTKGGFTTKDVKKVLPKTEKKNSLGIFASKVAKELFEQSSDMEEVKKILTRKKPMGKTELYSKAEVEKAILIYTIKQEN